MKKIMIVDDEVLVRVGIKSLLKWEDYGYTIVADASDGKEAFEKIKELQPDIVLTDLMMEPENGFWLMEECKKSNIPVKFIVLSNYNDMDNVKHAMKIGASDYIFKLTVKPQELLSILEELEPEQRDYKSEDATNNVLYKNRDAIKKNVYKRLTSAHVVSVESIRSELKNMPLHVNLDKNYCILYVKIDNFKVEREKGNFSDLELLNFTVTNIAEEIFQKSDLCDIFSCKEYDMAVVFQIEESYEKSAQRIETEFVKFSSYINQYFGFKVSGYLSLCHKGIEKFKDAAFQNELYAENRFFGKSGSFLIYSENAVEKQRFPFEEKLKELENTESNAIETAEKALEILEHLEKGQWKNDEEEIRNFLRYLYKKVSFCFAREDISTQKFINEDKILPEDAVRMYDYYEDIYNTLKKAIDTFMEEYRDKYGRKCRKEILQAIDYVEKHMNEDLSVAGIASMVNMSESRFSHVFKDEMGISYLEYVNHLRMDRAFKLLKTTNLKVNEVAEQIGIYNANYFSAQFKKKTGFSPNEFRKKEWQDDRK